MRNIIKFNILFLLISFMLSGCNRTQCIEADDFGFASVTVSARYPNNGSTTYVNSYQNKDMGAWLDTGYFLTGAPLAIMVSNWKWNLNLGVTSNNTGTYLSAWSPWFGSAKYYNYLPASIVNLRACIFGASNSTTCFSDGTPDTYRIANAPCLMTRGIGLYGLIQQSGATSPNTSVTSQASPSGYSFHVGAKENNAALFDASGAAGGIIISGANNQDISNYTGGKLFLKILDVNYGDNAGQYIVKIKSGVRNLGVDPFKAFADKFQQIIFAGNGTTPGIVPTIYGNILTQTGFLKAVKAILTLYIFFTGAGFLIGIVHFTAWEVLNRVIKILIIGALLSPNSWSYFSGYLFNTFMYGANQIIGMIEYAATGGYASGGESIIALLFAEETLAKLSSLIWYDWTGIVYVLMFIVLLLLVTYIYLKAWIFFITAFLFVGVMLSLTPIFLCFMLFGWTHHLYKGWLDKLIAYSMQPIILFTALAFLGSMIRSEIYNTLGFKVCLHNVFSMNITNNPYSLLNMYYPEPIAGTSMQTISVPKPWTNAAAKQCRAYECQDNRYLELPYLDPNSPEDAARINAFKSGTYIHLDALAYLIVTAIIMLFFNDSALAIATGIFGGGLSAAAANAAAKGAAKYAWDASKYVAGKASATAAKNFRDSLRSLGMMKETEQQRKERIAKEKAEGKTTFSKAQEGLSKASTNAKAGWHKFKEGANPNSATNIKNKMSAATKKRADAKTALDEAKARQAKFTGSQDPSKQNKLSGLFQKSPDAQVAKLQKDFDKAQKSEMGVINKLKSSKQLEKELQAASEKLTTLKLEGKDKDAIHNAQQKAQNLQKAYLQAAKREEWADRTTAQKVLGNEGAAKLAARNQKTADSFAKLKADSGALNNKIARAFGKGKTSEELGKELEQAQNKLNIYKTGQQVSKLMKNAKELQDDMNATTLQGERRNLGRDIQKLEERTAGRSAFRNVMSGDALRLRNAKSKAGKLFDKIEQQKVDNRGNAEKVKLLDDTQAAIQSGMRTLAKAEGSNETKKLAEISRNQKWYNIGNRIEVSRTEREVVRLTKAHDAAKQGEETRRAASEKRTSDLAAKQTARDDARQARTDKRDEERESKLALALKTQDTTERSTLQTRAVENVRKQVAASAKLDAAQDREFSRFNPAGKWLNDRNIKSLEGKLGKYQDRQDSVLGRVKDEDAGRLSSVMEGARVDSVRQNYSNAVRDITNISKDKVKITDQLYAADKQRTALESQVAKLSQSLGKSKGNVVMQDIYQHRLNRALEALDKNNDKTTELQSKYSKNSQKEERLLSLRTDDISSAHSRAQGAADPKLQQIVDKNVTKATEQTSKALTALYEGYTSGKSGKELEKLQQSYAGAKDNERQAIARGASMGIKPTLDLSNKPFEALQKRMEQDQAKMDVRASVANPDALAGAKQNLESQKSRMSNLTEVQSAQKQLAKAEAGHNKSTGELNKMQERAESLRDNRGNMSMVQFEVLSKRVADDKKQVDNVGSDIAKYQGQIKQQQEFLAKPENQDAVKFLSQNQISKGVGQLQDQLALSGAQKQVTKLEGEQKAVEKFTSGFEGFKGFIANQKTESAPSEEARAQSSTSSPVGSYGIADLAQRASAPMLSPQVSSNSAVASAPPIERSAQSFVIAKSSEVSSSPAKSEASNTTKKPESDSSGSDKK